MVEVAGVSPAWVSPGRDPGCPHSPWWCWSRDGDDCCCSGQSCHSATPGRDPPRFHTVDELEWRGKKTNMSVREE